MKEKIAIVTGGTGGIGTAICRRLASDYTVIACYFKKGNHHDATQWQTIQREAGYKVEILYADSAVSLPLLKLFGGRTAIFYKR